MSPDGTKVLYVAGIDGDPELYSLEISTGSSTQLTFNDIHNGAGDWSPDGSKIVFSQNVDGNYDLFILDLATNSTSLLVDTATDASYPEWSPDGSEIAFISSTSSWPELAIINIDGTQLRQVPNIDTVLWNNFSWSPTGVRFALGTGLGEHETYGIYTVNNDGSNVTRYTTGTHFNVTWSPDESQIAFTRREWGVPGEWTTEDILVLCVSGTSAGTITALTLPQDRRSNHPNWSHSGTNGISCEGSPTPTPTATATPIPVSHLTCVSRQVYGIRVRTEPNRQSSYTVIGSLDDPWRLNITGYMNTSYDGTYRIEGAYVSGDLGQLLSDSQYIGWVHMDGFSRLEPCDTADLNQPSVTELPIVTYDGVNSIPIGTATPVPNPTYTPTVAPDLSQYFGLPMQSADAQGTPLPPLADETVRPIVESACTLGGVILPSRDLNPYAYRGNHPVVVPDTATVTVVDTILTAYTCLAFDGSGNCTSRQAWNGQDPADVYVAGSMNAMLGNFVAIRIAWEDLSPDIQARIVSYYPQILSNNPRGNNLQYWEAGGSVHIGYAHLNNANVVPGTVLDITSPPFGLSGNTGGEFREAPFINHLDITVYYIFDYPKPWEPQVNGFEGEEPKFFFNSFLQPSFGQYYTDNFGSVVSIDPRVVWPSIVRPLHVPPENGDYICAIES